MKMNEKKWIVGGASLAVLVGAVLIAFWIGREPPPDPRTATTEQTLDFLASDRFVNMSQDKKRRYLDQFLPDDDAPFITLSINPADIPPDRRQKLLENILPVITPKINQRFDEFEQMSPDQQTAHLDKIIDRLALYRQNNPAETITPRRMNTILQHMDPYLRARFRKHMPALMARMAARGVKPLKGMFDNLVKK